MDRLPEIGAETRAATCPEHGPFVSRNIIGRIWSQCERCEDQRRENEAESARKAELERREQRHRAMINEARIPARFDACTFDAFIADTDEKRHALTVAREFVEDFAEHARKGSTLIFAGKPGTGKSHLAGAILLALLGRDVRYMTCMDMIRAVRETWRRDSEKSEMQVLGYLERLDLLVIDEVGMQYGTEGEQTILFDVLDRRYREMRPSVILTNQDKAGLSQFLGERTYDRLRHTGRMVIFDWPSYRAQARATT